MAHTSLYVVRSHVLGEMFGQSRSHINKPVHLWKSDGPQASGQRSRDKKRVKMDDLDQYACATVEDAYLAIVQGCAMSRPGFTFTAGELFTVIPHPDPQAAASVGSAFGQGYSAEPPSRRGEVRKSRKRGGKKEEDGEEGDSGDSASVDDDQDW